MNEMQELYQRVILDHRRSPRNFGRPANYTHLSEGYNPLCGDRVAVYMNAPEDHIERVSFDGEGCALCLSAASLLTEALQGLARDDVDRCVEAWIFALKSGDTRSLHDAFKVFSGASKYPARIKCITLSWRAALAALKGEAGVSTEGDQIVKEGALQ